MCLCLTPVLLSSGNDLILAPQRVYKPDTAWGTRPTAAAAASAAFTISGAAVDDTFIVQYHKRTQSISGERGPLLGQLISLVWHCY